MSDSGSDVSMPGRGTRWLYWPLFCGLTLFLWLATVRWPRWAGFNDNNEISWRLILHEAFAQRWQWGRDIQFTYGPLGCFLNELWYPSTWRYSLVWIFGFETLCCGMVAQVILEIRCRIAQTMLVILFLSMAFLSPIFGPDVLFLVVLWLIITGFIMSGSRSLPRAFLIAFVAIVLSLAKFTLMVWCLVAFCAVLVKLWRIRGWRAACGLGGGSGIMAVAAWMACKQSLSGFVDYLISSREISQGYALAMGVAGPGSELVHAGVCGAGLLLSLAIGVACRRDRWPALLAAGISVLTLLLIWKHAFVRHDLHSLIFFMVVPCLALTCYLGPEGLAGNRFWRSVLFLLVVATAATSLREGTEINKRAQRNLRPQDLPRAWFDSLVSNTKTLFRLKDYLSEQESIWQTTQERNKIPELNQRVGREPVAWFMDSQSVPLMTGVALAPRGVPQSYSVYTPWLVRENAKPFQKATAPRFAVVNIQPIDLRWPLGEDSLALLQVFSNYRQVGNYGGNLLFERNPTVAAVEPVETDLVDQRCRFGESVEVPRRTGRNWKVFSVELPFSRKGKLLTGVFKAPEVRLQLDCWDGPTHDYKLIPGQCEMWSLLDPLIVENQALPTLFVGDQHREVRRIRIAVAENARDQFQELLRIRVREYPAPPRLPDEMFDPLMSPAMFTSPVEVNSSLHGPRLRHGKSVYLLGAPGSAKLVLPKNCRQVQGFMGLKIEERDPAIRENGVRFAISHVAANGSEKVLIDRRLNPWKNPAESEEQEFTVQLDGTEGGWLKLSTDCGTTLASCCYWRDIRSK